MLTEGGGGAAGAVGPPPARFARSRCSKLPIDPRPTGALAVAPPLPAPPEAALAPFSVFTRFAACPPPPFSIDIMIEPSSLSPGLPRFSPQPPPSSICLFNSTSSFLIASSVAASSKTEDRGFVARRRGVWPAMAAASIAARSGSMPVASNRACSSVCFRESSRSRAMLRDKTGQSKRKVSTSNATPLTGRLEGRNR